MAPRKLTCAECGTEWDYECRGRPPVVCSPGCKDVRSKRLHREKYERNREEILERNRRYREPIKDEIAAKVREKREINGDEIRQRDRERYAEDPERFRESRRRAYRNNKESYQEGNRRHYQENREKYLESAREYRKKYGDKIRARRVELDAESPDKYRSQGADRRARLNDAYIESVSLNVLLERDSDKCGICGGEIPAGLEYGNPLYPHIDHIIPLSKGGEHSYKNTHPAHASCNVQKGTMIDGWQNIKPITREDHLSVED